MSTLPLFTRSQLIALDPPKLRPYQSRAIQALRNHIWAGKKRILLVAPTGSGKTTIIASIIRTSSVRVLFVADAMELIDQCVEDLSRVGITNVGVMRGDDERTNPNATVQVASIQTLLRRDKPEAGIILIDEAHLSASDSYVTHIFDHYKDAIIIGFTATPARTDGKPLGNLYEVLEVVCTYEELLKIPKGAATGFLAEPLCYSGPAMLDLSTVRMVGGDYDEDSLSEVMRDQGLIGNLLEQWQKLANLYPRDNGHPGLIEGEYRRTFIFAVNVPHSQTIQARFWSAGVRIAHLDGKTPEKERRRILRALEDGSLQAVTSVGVLLKGIDIPAVKCVLHARPTQSLVLWRQSCGRILRPWHPNCRRGCVLHPSVQPMLIDHGNNINRLGFPHEDLHWELRETTRAYVRHEAVRICKGCFAYLKAWQRLCPHCGADAPPPAATDLPRESEEQLSRLATTPEAMRRMYFDMIVKVARLKGYKPGFASARYKDRYGAWPPWEWSEQVKSSFASDPEWQASYEARAVRRKQREVEKLAKEQAKTEGATGDDDDVAF